MDFSKLPKPKATRTAVTYRCAKCGAVEEYAWEMPKGWRHYPLAGRCEGLLVEVSRREVPR